jgi:hypothetical protein
MKTFVLFGLIIAAAFPCGFLDQKLHPRSGVSGLVFFNTTMLSELKRFYRDEVGCEMWLDQGSCLVFRYGNLLFGFCQGERADRDALITFFYQQREDVDRAYAKFSETAVAPPIENPRFRIYHFYARDPEGRRLEFQHFLHPLDWDFDAVQSRKRE